MNSATVALSLFVWLVSLSPHQQLGNVTDGSQDLRLTILRATTHETERGGHDFCLSRSHYTYQASTQTDQINCNVNTT